MKRAVELLGKGAKSKTIVCPMNNETLGFSIIHNAKKNLDI